MTAGASPCTYSNISVFCIDSLHQHHDGQYLKAVAFTLIYISPKKKLHPEARVAQLCLSTVKSTILD